MKKQFCEECMEYRECTCKEGKIKEIIDGNVIEYLEKYYVCNKCNSKIYGDLLDYNVSSANNELRKKTGLITISEIKEIMNKYNIGQKPLSKVLGLGEVTISRYLNGQNPTKENSVLLKNILNNPFLYELFLEGNKDNITKVAYKKSLGKTKQIELTSNNSKLYNISLYYISKAKEMDPLSLQKILYFCEGFSSVFLNHNLFNDLPESWIYGPVYRDIYNSLSYYGSDKINYNELLKNRDFNLSNEEEKYVNEILNCFGCYSGTVLREMTHLTDPWIDSRKGLTADEPSNRIISKQDIESYFKKICREYNIQSLNDIHKYSEDLFKKARENLFK